MICYLLSNIPSYVKINGIYVGKISQNVKIIETENTPFFEFLPENENFRCVYGCEKSQNLLIVKIKNSLFVTPNFSKLNCHPFKVLFQKQVTNYNHNVTITAVLDGCVKFFIDGFITSVKTLPFIPNGFDAYFYKKFLRVSFYAEKTALFIYSLDSGNLIFSDLVDEFSVTDIIETKKRYFIVTKSVINEQWTLDENSKLILRRDFKERDFFQIHPSLIPLAFFENVNINASVKDIVTPDFNSKITNLYSFLGKSNAVINSPFNKDEVLLIKNDVITSVKCEFTNRLISNVFAEDYN